MKRNTHVYIVHKAIEFMRDSVDNLLANTSTNSEVRKASKVSKAKRGSLKTKAKKLQRLMYAHRDSIIEAAWASDALIHDKRRFHTFKLFKDGIFDAQEAKAFRKQTYRDIYHRGSDSGGAPYKVDHIAAVISDFRKLREYNDNFSTREIQYLYILASHYIVDLHVPMHCDLRDDPPAQENILGKPGPLTAYFNKSLHGTVEDRWEKAVTPLAIESGYIDIETHKECSKRTEYSCAVEFDLEEMSHRALIRPVYLDDTGIMDFMIDRGICSFERSLEIWPPSEPEYSSRKVTKEITRKIFAEAISSVISVWLAID